MQKPAAVRSWKASPPAPAGWIARRMPDGCLLLTRSSGDRLLTILGLLLMNLFWNGILSIFIARGISAQFHRQVITSPVAPGGWAYWMLLSPFILLGLQVFKYLLRSVFLCTELSASSGSLRIHRSLLFWRWNNYYAQAVFTLSTEVSKNSTHRLRLEGHGETVNLDACIGSDTRVRTLGALLVRETGWSIKRAPYTRD